MNIGYSVRFCRQQKRITIPELARRAELSTSYLSLVERGKREPSFDALNEICRALQVPMSVLIFLGSDPSELSGLTEEVREKLSSAVLKLLRLGAGDPSQEATV